MRDPRWIGAWWMGFVSLFGILIISGTLLLLFPKQMKDGRIKRDAAIKEGHLPSSDDNIKYTIKDLLWNQSRYCSIKHLYLQLWV